LALAGFIRGFTLIDGLGQHFSFMEQYTRVGAAASAMPVSNLDHTGHG